MACCTGDCSNLITMMTPFRTNAVLQQLAMRAIGA
jgi:hypothetical protein